MPPRLIIPAWPLLVAPVLAPEVLLPPPSDLGPPPTVLSWPAGEHDSESALAATTTPHPVARRNGVELDVCFMANLPRRRGHTFAQWLMCTVPAVPQYYLSFANGKK